MERIEKFLQERKDSGLFRVLHPARFRKTGKIYFKDKEFFDFSSNDYLGLSEHPKLKEAAKKAIENWGVSASASRLLSGSLEIHQELEQKIAQFKDKEKALVFNSGYQANVGIISALCKKGDVVFSDRLNHASLLDGITLSQAKLFRFLHNDLNHLEYLLKKERDKFKECLIITETIFSMDGDRALLKELVGLKEKYNTKIMVDEAHATGIYGKKGTGLVEQENLADRVDLIMGTFSKALGGFGAYVAASSEAIDYLINTARSFIYSTALPASVIAANIASLELIKEEPYRRKKLLENADYFRDELNRRGFEIKGTSQIVPLIVKDTSKAVNLSAQLQDKGFWVLPIRPPTVPVGCARLRFSLSFEHKREVLQKLLEALKESLYEG